MEDHTEGDRQLIMEKGEMSGGYKSTLIDDPPMMNQDKQNLIDADPSNKKKPNSVEKMRIRLAALAFGSQKNKSEKSYDAISTSSQESKDEDKSLLRRCAEKVLIPLLVLLGLCLVILVGFAFLSVSLKVRLDHTASTCLSTDCVMTAGGMLAMMEPKRSPCQDFYQFACGRFNDAANRPADKSKWSVFEQTRRRTNTLIHALLTGEHQVNISSVAIEKAQRLYNSCMDTHNVNGTKQILALVKQMGSWPLTSGVDSGKWPPEGGWDLNKALNFAFAMGVMPFLQIYLSPDLKNNTQYVMYMDQSGLMFASEEMYRGTHEQMFHDAYVRFFHDVGKQLGISDDLLDFYGEELWGLEKVLAGAFANASSRVEINASYNPRTVDEIGKIFSSGRSSSSLNIAQLLGDYFYANVLPEDVVIVAVPSYLNKMSQILSNAKDETLAAYIGWSVVRSMVPFAGPKFDQALLNLRSVTEGVQANPPQWEKCTEIAVDGAGFAVGAAYVNMYFSENDKQKVEKFVTHIISEFKKNLNDVEWMDDKTKDMAKEKVDAIAIKVGFPAFITDPVKLDKHYEDLLVGDNLFQNILNIETFGLKRIRNKVGQVPDRSEWFAVPTEVNAYYSPQVNEIIIPAGILQPPFYHPSYPKSVLFGSLGFVVGHEITHGFDNKGSKFDKFGNLKDWWSPSASIEYHNRTQCFVNEYNGYTLEGGYKLNGLTTLGENIADNGGLKISKAAYERWVSYVNLDPEAGLEDLLLPGLNMTRIQQFYLSGAQVWCGSSSVQQIRKEILTNPHTPSIFRVNGILANFPEFFKSFNCPPLKSDKICVLW